MTQQSLDPSHRGVHTCDGRCLKKPFPDSSLESEGSSPPGPLPKNWEAMTSPKPAVTIMDVQVVDEKMIEEMVTGKVTDNCLREHNQKYPGKSGEDRTSGGSGQGLDTIRLHNGKVPHETNPTSADNPVPERKNSGQDFQNWMKRQEKLVDDFKLSVQDVHNLYDLLHMIDWQDYLTLKLNRLDGWMEDLFDKLEAICLEELNTQEPGSEKKKELA